MKPWHHVIIGSGPAGIFAAEAIRERDPESFITMLTAESSPANSPVMLTYWMGGEVGRSALFFRDPSWGERRKIDVRLNTGEKIRYGSDQEKSTGYPDLSHRSAAAVSENSGDGNDSHSHRLGCPIGKEEA